MDRLTLFANVLLPLPVEGTFTYRVPFDLNEFIKVGQRVSVQFGRKKIYAGLVKKIHTDVPQNYVHKYIITLLDELPIVNNIQLRFWEWMSGYYMSTEGEVMSAAMPTAFKLASESKVVLSPNFIPDFNILNPFEYQVTEALLENKKLSVDEISKLVGYQKVLPLLKTMIEQRIIVMAEELSDIYKPKTERFVCINEEFINEIKLQEVMDDLGKRAHKQLELLITFISLVGLPLTEEKTIKQSDLLKKAGGSQSALKSLFDKNIMVSVNKVVSRFEEETGSESAEELKLSPHQFDTYNNILQSFNKHNVVLLHGVTSGGKTEVYIKLIADTIKSGKQVLYMLPEIALTTQIINRLRKYFGDEVGVYHSRYSQNERVEVWNNIAGLDDDKIHKKYSIILGPRSSLFLPYDNLGLIIVDEEHDGSYKQYEPAPRYNARDAAIYLATLHNTKVLLGSATPAIESYYNAKSGKYGFAEITNRYGGVKLPKIVVVNLREEQRRRMMKSHFSSVLLENMNDAIEKEHQIILFQNRRGFSLRIECDVCHWIPQCKNCDVTLTYHKYSELIKCHYCGYSTTVPPKCEDCGNTGLKMQGFGTEKVAEELSLLLPDVKIDRMDLDTTRTKNAFSRIISDFENKRTNILIGTQMVTKGLDFDNVQVVGVLSADNMLSFPDFRAHERSFQLMLQVSGRSGRKDKQGMVIIQAWKPDHPILKDVINHDYDSMYVRQLAERKKFNYPPFYRLIIIRMKHKKAEILNEGAAVLTRDLREKFGKLIYGPEYPLVGRVRNFYIKQTLIKIPRNVNLSEVKSEIYKSLITTKTNTKFKSIIVQFDVDPQ
ncbi:MAG: primosomal protein N' [Bacteroidetes bacterium]|nr:primosomal protein N' [Bacteroidota bacterium]MBL6943486.1 primosomal protein N' [Bacteroidales bacterium]